MWRSATCSDAGARRGGSGGPSRRAGRAGGRRPTASTAAVAAVAVLAGAALLAGPAAAQTFLTQEEALRLAFPPPAEVERRTAFLDDATLERARELAGPGVEVDQRVVTYYVGRSEDATLGHAYFDAHRVRTLREVLMVVLTPDGRVDRIEVLKFAEPRDYLAPERWLEQFEGATVDGGAEAVNITGATLTSRAVERAVRRVLALHRVIAGEGTAAAGEREGRG